MDPTFTAAQLAAAAEPDAFGRYLAGIRPAPGHMGGMGGMGGQAGRSSSVRTAQYQGHRIRIVTTYDITVDGRALPAALDVDRDGLLFCHGLPAYQFYSAVDTVEALIRHFPGAFDQAGGDKGSGGQDGGGGQGGGGGGGG